MRKKISIILQLLILLGGAVFQAAGYVTSAANEGLPERLLQGMQDFGLAIQLQGDLRGNFGPCGCRVNPMGGFARRMSYWNAFAKQYPTRSTLRLDGGSIFQSGTFDASVINRWMLEGSYRSNVDALNLSAWDLPIWREMGDLARAGQVPPQFLKLPLVSANVVATVPSFPVVQPYVVKQYVLDPRTRKPFRIGITGLLSDPEERISRSEFQIADPEDAVRKVIDELKNKTDYRIVLTDMDLGKAISLAVRVPGISLILVAHNYESPLEAQQVGDTLVTFALNEGRALNEVRIGLAPNSDRLRVETRFVALDHTIPDDPVTGEWARKAQTDLDNFRKAQ